MNNTMTKIQWRTAPLTSYKWAAMLNLQGLRS